jgi:hypothetical protein
MNKDSLLTALSRFIILTKHLLNETHQAEDRRIYEMYLAYSGVILAKIVQGQGIGDDIDSMEHLFGNTWLKDKKSYSQAYSSWDEFKQLLTQSIHGMTVNERLFNLGLMDEFDKAVEKDSESLLRVVLSKCFLSEDNILAIIKQQLRR